MNNTNIPSFLSLLSYNNGKLSIPYCKGILYTKLIDIQYQFSIYLQQQNKEQNQLPSIFLDPFITFLEEIFSQSIHIIHDLHTNCKSIHGDLRPENILINHKCEIIILQPSVLVVNGNLVTDRSLSPFTTIPPGLQYTGAADLFSLGMILYWLSSGGILPFIYQSYTPMIDTITTTSSTTDNNPPLSILIEKLQTNYTNGKLPILQSIPYLSITWNKLLSLLLLYPFRAYDLLLLSELSLNINIDNYLITSPKLLTKHTQKQTNTPSPNTKVKSPKHIASPTTSSSKSPTSSSKLLSVGARNENIGSTENYTTSTIPTFNDSIDIDISAAEIEAVLSNSLESEEGFLPSLSPSRSSHLSPKKQTVESMEKNLKNSSPLRTRLQRTPPPANISNISATNATDNSNNLDGDNNITNHATNNLLRLRQIKKATLHQINNNTNNETATVTIPLPEAILSESEKAHEEALRLARLAAYNERVKLQQRQKQAESSQQQDDNTATIPKKKTALARTPPQSNVINPKSVSPGYHNTSIPLSEIQVSNSTSTNTNITSRDNHISYPSQAMLRKQAQADKLAAEREYELQQARITAFQERKALANRARNVFEPSISNTSSTVTSSSSSVVHSSDYGGYTNHNNYSNNTGSSSRSSSISSSYNNNHYGQNNNQEVHHRRIIIRMIDHTMGPDLLNQKQQ